MNCPNCGNEINENQKFCSSCGTNLENNDNKFLKQIHNFKLFSNPLIITAIIMTIIAGGFVYAINSNTNEKIKTNTENKAEETEVYSTTFDPDIARKILEETNGNEEEIISKSQEYAYNYDYEHNKIPIGFNPRKCLFKVKNICFGHPFYVKGMSYMDCKNLQNELGIKYCKESDDKFASTAYVCGGVKYMPTPDELILLAEDLYGANIFDNLENKAGCTGSYAKLNCNYTRATRNNNKDYLDYFRNLSTPNTYFKNADEEQDWYNKEFYVMSNTESPLNKYRECYWAYGRTFANNSSSLIKINRILDGAVSICVQRDKNYEIPTQESYPIKQKTYEEEAENELF